MQSTGQTETQEMSSTSMHGSAMTYVIQLLLVCEGWECGPGEGRSDPVMMAIRFAKRTTEPLRGMPTVRRAPRPA
jgi:hypothetical protein